ncbi:hypothetical protein GGR58DRAFT_507912 [Xylaria digitata]|nr:hypothetical protein GGR58DRAFT_507912 [Xylaria digitata]
MSWGVTPPRVMFSDTLALFKVIKGMKNSTSLSSLVTACAPWIEHKPHDAVSDAKALMSVMKVVFPNEIVAGRNEASLLGAQNQLLEGALVLQSYPQDQQGMGAQQFFGFIFE